MAEIYTNLDQTKSTRTRMSGTFYWRGLFVAPIFRFPPVRAGAHAFLHFPSTRSNSPVCTAEWRSHSSGIRHSISNFALAIPPYSTLLFHRVERPSPSLTALPPSSYTTLPRLSSICRDCISSSLPQTSVQRARIRASQSVFSVLASFAFR